MKHKTCIHRVIGAVTLLLSPLLSPLLSAQDQVNAMTDLYQGEVGKSFEVELADGVKLVMKYCPAGTFMMGSPVDEDGRRDDEEQVEVTLDSGYWLAETECTWDQWYAVMGYNTDEERQPGDLPVTGADASMAQNYIAYLRENHAAAGWRWSLPREAQWEYACRAGTTTRFHCGGDPGGAKLKEYAWFAGNSDNTMHPVGKKAPNAWGLHDMHGNAWEWVRRGTGAGGEGAAVEASGASGGEAVLRGGDYRSGAEDCRSARRWTVGKNQDGAYGFRVALVRPARTESLTSKRAFDVPKEVAAFVGRIIERDPAVRARYDQRIAAVKEEAGGHFNEGEFVAIEWLVPSYTGRWDPSGSDTEAVYLVQRQLISGYRGGYSVPDNVVAQVTVTIQTDTVSKDGGEQMVVSGSILTLHFDGFVDLGVVLDPVASGE